MKKELVLPNKRAFLSILLVCTMIISVVQGSLSVSAETVSETVDSWTMTSELVTGGSFSQPWYAMVKDPVDSKADNVLSLNARANQHNHGYGRAMAFNDGTNYISLAAGKYTVNYKYYLEQLEEGFYTIECGTGNCNTTIANYNDGTSASSYELYFGVASGADFNIASSKLVSKSNSLFSYETAKNVDFERYGWQNGTVAFVVTEDMVNNNNNIFAMYSVAVGHAVYLKDITVSKCSTPVQASELGLISDFTKEDTLPATDSTSVAAGAMSVNNATNSIYNNSNRFVAADVDVPGAGNQSVMAITFNNNKRAMCFTTGLEAKDFVSLKSGTKYQIAFDFYNPSYAEYDNTLSPVLNLTDVTDENPIVSDGTISKGMVTLLSGEEIYSNVAANGYVRIVKEFEVPSDKTVNRLGLYTYCKSNTVLKPYYIDNIQIVEANNTAVFDIGNRNIKTDNITVTYGNAITAPQYDTTTTRAGNISGWRDEATGDVYDFGAVIPKEATAKYLGTVAVFVAAYDNEITFDFEGCVSETGSVPGNISGQSAKLDTTADEGNKSIAFTQVGGDRHFLLYSQEGTVNVTALASYEKYRTYEISFDYKCTALGTGKTNIYAAMGVQFYSGSTKNALYKPTLIEITQVSEDWQRVTAYVMAPGSYDTNENINIEPAEGESTVYPFVDGKYIGLGITGFLEGETGSTVLFDNVTVKSVDYMLGDVSGNSVINATDLASLRTHIIGDKLLTDTTNADVKKDGEINAADIVRLKKYLAAAQ